MRRRMVLVNAATSCALVISLASCGSANPKPAPAPTVSVSSSAPPPGEVAPTMPAEAKGTSEAAAKAFVRHFVETLNYAGDTGETSVLRRLYSQSCLFCEGIADGLDRVKRNGGTYRSAGWTIKNLSPYPAGEGRLQILAIVRVAPQVVVVKQGASPRGFKGDANGRRRFTLKSDAGNWIVADLADPT